MSASALRDSQMLMARYLRDPQGQPAPEGVEERRLKIYRDLVYNNVEGFISGGFPVLRSLYRDEDWHQLVREFIDQHRCHTPYFLEISQEFLKFLMQRDESGPNDPPFLLELAHYEWVELALDVAEYCKRWGWEYEEILGSERYMHRLIQVAEALETTDDDFVVIPPGGETQQSMFLR